MQKWEYKYLEAMITSGRAAIPSENWAFQSVSEFLNYIGENGWELVSVFLGEKGARQSFYFKRPKE